MTTQPQGLFGRLLCLLQGEVSADTLEAYRRASMSVFELLDRGETMRLGAAAEGKNPWTLPENTQVFLLCTWNAFVLQTLGNNFLDADYRGNPATAGFVPPITADQVLAFYQPVEGWLSRAQQAEANPNYKLDLAVPTDLPAWSEVEPCPNSHLHGMLEAMKSVRDHAQAAMNVLEQTEGLTKEQDAQRDAVRQAFAGAISKARYAEDMHRGGNPSRDIHERVEEHVKVAIELFYKMGQLAAMPRLATARPAPKDNGAGSAAPKRLPGPGESGFDPWILTDLTARRRYTTDDQARKAVQTLWKLDPDPRKTLEIKAEVDAAYTRGDITFAKDRMGNPIGYFFCCPWGPIYSVVRPVTLGGVKLVPLQQFVYDVTAEGYNLGVPFRRQIKIGTFASTDEFEYGDPDEEPDH